MLQLHPYEPAADWREEDYRLGLPSNEQIDNLAAAMNISKDPKQGNPQIIRDFRRIALYGERTFARHFGLRMDTRVLKYGNGRINFRLSDDTTIDVVTRKPPKKQPVPDLVLPVNKRTRVDVLVLCVFHGYSFEPELLGWIPEKEMRERGSRVTYAYRGTENFELGAAMLNPMWKLLAMHAPDDPRIAEWRAEEEQVIRAAAAPEPALIPAMSFMFDDGEVRRRDDRDKRR